LAENQGEVRTPTVLINHGDAGIENAYWTINGGAHASLANIQDNGVGENIDQDRVDTGFQVYINVVYISA
jgi:hypothetical protein